MLKILSLNINGVGKLTDEEVLGLLSEKDPDIICLQEIRKSESNINHLPELLGYTIYSSLHKSKNESGVAVYTKIKPKIMEIVDIKEFGGEGRVQILEFEEFKLINVYVPWKEEKSEKFVKELEKTISKIKEDNIILCGDFNVARTKDDLTDPGNAKTGFTKKEKEALENMIKECDLIDTFRKCNSESTAESKYTWVSKSTRGANEGKWRRKWRIDYIFTSKNLENNLKEADIILSLIKIDKNTLKLDTPISTHNPTFIEINLE